MIALWGANSDWDPNNDADEGIGDYLLDDDEPELGGTPENPVNGGPFVAGILDTDGDTMMDCEDYTLHTQAEWITGSADHQDWASPGQQSGSAGPPPPPEP